MLNNTQRDLIKKIVLMSNFSDVLDCMIEVATNEGLSNYKVGNDGAGEDLYQIEEILCAAKTKIRGYEQNEAGATQDEQIVSFED